MTMVMIAAGISASGGWMLMLAALVVVGAITAIIRGVDVRLALLAAAGLLSALAGDITPVVRKFLATFSDEKFIVPICSAMGFAYVLRHTHCDQHLVHLLTRPLRHARLLLIPGVAFVGFLVNIPVISQTSTAVCLGAVVVPLMRAAGITPVTVGATVLLGCSLGGELLNPGAPELSTVSQRLDKPEKPVQPQDVVPSVSRIILYHLALATAIFWWMSVRCEKAAHRSALANTDASNEEVPATLRVNYLRALVPLIPLVLLFLSGPPLNIFKVPTEWVVDVKAKSSYGTRLIGLAMLVGVVAVTLVVPRQAGTIPKAFCEGAGYAYGTIISIIVTASCFGTAVEQIGLADRIAELVRAVPNLLIPMAAGIPFAFATLCGSGMASTQSLYAFFVPPAESLGVDCLDLGAVVSVGAASGRTMSPVAAVTLMCASMTHTNPFALVKRTALPLVISWIIVIALRMMRVI